MEMIRVTLPDGSVREAEKGIIAGNFVKGISEGLFRNAICVSIDNNPADLNSPLINDCFLKVHTFNDELGRDVYRHTASHIMAQAVKKIFPTVKIAIGPSIKKGFYYDFEFKTPITLDDFCTIEAEMQKIIKADFPLIRKEITRSEAKKMFTDFDEQYKSELLENIPEGEKVTLYEQGGFIDLCRGPHLPSTGKIKAFKLTSLAGAYWKGDSKNKMLTRIYGTAFDKKSDLDAYVTELEEAKKRDHNKLGRELGYFMTDENIGQGLPLIMPKGAKVIQILQRFVEDEDEKRGYVLTRTPMMAKNDLYKISGHWQHYRDGMFVIGDESKGEEVLALRPMTCPFQFMIYKNGLKSYRDLPVRFSETATLFRNESSGEMHGLIRVRQFTLSDGHIICAKEQLESEFSETLKLCMDYLKKIGLHKDITFRFSRWDPKNSGKYIDNPKAWEESEAMMKAFLDNSKLEYTEGVGDAAFYGPKLDLQIENVYGKEDTLVTIQLDFELSERFGMTYIDANNTRQFPYIIHRSSIGCYERTLALLIEKYSGALPLWLSPLQVKVLSLTERTAEECLRIVNELKKHGIRAEVDNRNEKVGMKIREAQLEKMPYMLIIGDNDVKDQVVSVRERTAGDIGAMPLEEFIKRIHSEVEQNK